MITSTPRPPDREVVEMYESVRARLQRTVDRHTAPYVPGSSIEARTYGACPHLRDRINGAPIAWIHRVEAFVHANCPDSRYCLRCSRRALWFGDERVCVCCGWGAVRGSKKRKHVMVPVNVVELVKPPVFLVIPLCIGCRAALGKHGIKGLDLERYEDAVIAA